MNYRHFESDLKPFEYPEKGFWRVRQVMDWCEQYGLYVVLDLHALPGGQNPDWHSDTHNRSARLWYEEHLQERTIRLWRELARRFGDHPALAGYDLINEPTTEDLDDIDSLNRLHRRLVQAIRGVDTRTIIFLEGNVFASRFEGFEVPFDANLAYSLHDYPLAPRGPGPYPGVFRGQYIDADVAKQIFYRREGVAFTARHNRPLWVGEFGAALSGPPDELHFRMQALADYLDVLDDDGASWTIWTLKDVGHMGLLQLAQDSPYMRLVGPLLQLKQQLLADPWIEWRDNHHPIVQAVADLGNLIASTAGTDVAQSQGRIKARVGDYVGDMLQDLWVDLFAGLSDDQIDHVLGSFAFEQCQVIEPLAEVLRAHCS